MKNIFHRTDIYKFRSKFDRKKNNLSFPFLLFKREESNNTTYNSIQIIRIDRSLYMPFFLALQNSFLDSNKKKVIIHV